jgi:hypothetical protein
MWLLVLVATATGLFYRTDGGPYPSPDHARRAGERHGKSVDRARLRTARPIGLVDRGHEQLTLKVITQLLQITPSGMLFCALFCDVQIVGEQSALLVGGVLAVADLATRIERCTLQPPTASPRHRDHG